MKFIVGGIILLIGLGYGGAKLYLHYKVSDGVDSAVDAIKPYANLAYGGISSTLTGELTIDDVTIQINGFRDDLVIGRLGIKTPSFLALLKLSNLSAGPQATTGEAPAFFGLIAENIQVPATADYYRHIYDENIREIAPSDIRQRGVQCVGKYGFSPETLGELGYEELVISMSIIMRQAETDFIAEVDFDVVDMADVEIDASVVGNLMAGAMSGASYRPRMRSLQMKMKDQSLNRRVEKYCTKLGLTPAQISNAHINALQYFGKQNGIRFDNYTINPYKEYLAGKSTLTITARPREPLDLARIKKYKPGDVPALLNLEAIAE